MSQSGCTSGAMKSELSALTATCVVCEAGSRGQKSSEARASAVSVILRRPSPALSVLLKIFSHM
jgi:hypothetical protein